MLCALDIVRVSGPKGSLSEMKSGGQVPPRVSLPRAIRKERRARAGLIENPISVSRRRPGKKWQVISEIRYPCFLELARVHSV